MEVCVGGSSVVVKAVAGIAVCVSVIILTVGAAVSIAFVGLTAGVDVMLLQEISIAVTKINGAIALPKIFTFACL